VATVFLCVPGFASSSPFYGPPLGATKKACLESERVWTPYLQTCTVLRTFYSGHLLAIGTRQRACQFSVSIESRVF
jgi:hypothetical protein